MPATAVLWLFPAMHRAGKSLPCSTKTRGRADFAQAAASTARSHGSADLGELGPVRTHVHALFVAGRKFVVVVAFQLRAHRQQVLDADVALARIGMLPLAIAKVVVDLGLRVWDQFALDCRTDQQPGDAFGQRAGVVQDLAIGTAQVVFVDQHTVAHDQHAGGGWRQIGGQRLFHLREHGAVPAMGGRAGDRPAVIQSRWRGGR